MTRQSDLLEVTDPGSQPRQSLISELALTTALSRDWLVRAQRRGAVSRL